MILALVWKEWREQRTIALAVLAFGVLALALTAQFVDPSSGASVLTKAGARELMALSLAYLAGAVCGAVLLADEKEVGTLEFLDTLPSRRRSLWAGKAVFGLYLVVGQCVALAVLAIVLGCRDERMSPIGYGSLVVLVGLLAFAWGMFGGAMARSTLGAVFQGSLASMAAAVLIAVPFVFVFGPRSFMRPFGPVQIGFYGVWLAVGLVGSALVFTTVDRQRSAPRPDGRPGMRPHRRIRGPGLRALFWLAARQVVYVALAALAGGGVLGAAMLAPDAVPIFLWTATTLAFGVLAGVTTLGEEQTRGVARFWAERRLPLGRFWLTKVAFHLAIAAAAALIAFLPLFFAVPALPFRSRLLSIADPGLRSELPRFVWLGLVYGFAVGHLMGMVFRKTIVAGLAAAVVAAVFLAFVLPGVIGGGAARWQVWGPAIVLVLTARLILYPWATERITARGPVLRAVGGIALAFAVVGAGLWYRVYEVPDMPDRLAESGFESTLPAREANVGGQSARAVVAQFRRATQGARALYPLTRTPANALVMVERGQAPPPANEIADPLERIALRGWRADSSVLEPWLNQVFAQDWPRLLEELPAIPVGVFDDPRDRDYFTPPEAINDLREMAAALRARGMQRQLAGDDDTFARFFRGGLAAVRSARHKTGVDSAQGALVAEETLLAGLTEWLGRLNGRADLLRVLVDELARHEREMPVGTSDSYWAQQIILRNTFDQLGSWLPRLLAPGRRDGDPANALSEAEAEVVAIAWTVPWERARRERIARAQTNSERPVNPRWLSGLHLTPVARSTRVERVAERDQRGLTHRRLAWLQVALRLYQLDCQEPAGGLGDLVPKYLPELLTDPYSGRPFRYRVSNGEFLIPSELSPAASLSRPLLGSAAVVAGLAFPVGGDGTWLLEHFFRYSESGATGFLVGVQDVPTSRPEIHVPKGHALVWSVGRDQRDSDGHYPVAAGMPSNNKEDWILVVPTRFGK